MELYVKSSMLQAYLGCSSTMCHIKKKKKTKACVIVWALVFLWALCSGVFVGGASYDCCTLIVAIFFAYLFIMPPKRAMRFPQYDKKLFVSLQAHEHYE